MHADDDLKYMRRALILARKGMRCTSPNPMVGAVLVKNRRVLGEGYHQCCGLAHAEIVALQDLSKRQTTSATLYVNLEPCCHYGKTPPCLPPILESGIQRIVIGTIDPNPQVNGKSIQELRNRGVEVELGLMESQCRELNRGYFKYVATGMPWVTVKIAQTLDGRIADSKGSSRWITGEASRKAVHRLRATHDAVLVGAGTVAKDDPQLTVRHIKGQQPRRIVLDPRLRIPIHAKLLTDQSAGAPWIITDSVPDPAKKSKLESLGARLIPVPDTSGYLPWEHILKILGKNGITSLLVEGGNVVFTNLLREAAADRIVVIIAPKFLGNSALASTGNLGIESLQEVLRYRIIKRVSLGEDLWLELEPKRSSSNLAE